MFRSEISNYRNKLITPRSLERPKRHRRPRVDHVGARFQHHLESDSPCNHLPDGQTWEERGSDSLKRFHSGTCLKPSGAQREINKHTSTPIVRLEWTRDLEITFDLKSYVQAPRAKPCPDPSGKNPPMLDHWYKNNTLIESMKHELLFKFLVTEHYFINLVYLATSELPISKRFGEFFPQRVPHTDTLILFGITHPEPGHQTRGTHHTYRRHLTSRVLGQQWRGIGGAWVPRRWRTGSL